MKWTCSACFGDSDSQSFPEGWYKFEIVWMFRENGVNKKFATHGYAVCSLSCQQALAAALTHYIEAKMS